MRKGLRRDGRRWTERRAIAASSPTRAGARGLCSGCALQDAAHPALEHLDPDLLRKDEIRIGGVHSAWDARIVPFVDDSARCA
ncbi:hypothetical protein LK07_04440 [Streptomyces pluripotens]|uniref:Uncharacterized protein n=1 Tax=Streptomyces pluripotens TaxID=1355015 RepID=A0A221NTT4_9ACTN|nr:hypothetical protein LK06_003355 [Streptomyces pluripotens]ASN23399.1 hypothetical protein LK07_04440 [Streptomyces pluripotens]KIE25660.1 hypothetical protein LK08_18285 [Streptomyces sp. MUSC 125]